MKNKNALAAIAGIVLASGIAANVYATDGHLHGSGCEATDHTTGVRSLYWGYENKNTGKTVTVVCPMNLVGVQSGDQGGAFIRLRAHVSNPSTNDPVKCRLAVRDTNGGHRYTSAFKSATSTGDFVTILISDGVTLPNLDKNFMIAECVLPKYSGTGTPPTIRAVHAE